MVRVTLKTLVEEYDAPRAIITKLYLKGGDCNRSGAKEEAEVYYWLASMVYDVFAEYEHPLYFKLIWDKEVKLVYSKYNTEIVLARFSLAFTCRHAYHKQDFKPLLCILSKLDKLENGETTFYKLAKQCSKQIE